MDRLYKLPDVVKKASLTERFAVVQETYIEGCVDMFFDEPLWRSLTEFLRGKSPSRTVQVTRESERKPVSLDEFLSQWDRTPPEDQVPPYVLVAMADERPILCMVTEFWNTVGGPQPYSDSYTYSFFSKDDVGAEVMAALKASPSQSRWSVASEVVTVAPPGPRAMTFEWLKRSGKVFLLCIGGLGIVTMPRMSWPLSAREQTLLLASVALVFVGSLIFSALVSAWRAWSVR
jgi:hypothetical protein